MNSASTPSQDPWAGQAWGVEADLPAKEHNESTYTVTTEEDDTYAFGQPAAAAAATTITSPHHAHGTVPRSAVVGGLVLGVPSAALGGGRKEREQRKQAMWPGNWPVAVVQGMDVVRIHGPPSPPSSSSRPRSVEEYCPAIPIDGPWFIGHAYLLIAGVDGAPTAEYFKGKSRQIQVVVQGRYRTEVPFAQVYTGQAWDEPLASAPPQWLEVMLTPVLKALQPGMRSSLHGPRPSIVSPLAATMQTLAANYPGQEPALPHGIAALHTDDLAAHGFAPGVSVTARKAFFSKPANLARYAFSPDLVYTFNFYQHLLRLDTFSIMGFDVRRVLGRKPVQVMAAMLHPDVLAAQTKDASHQQELQHAPTFLWNFEVWHESAF